MGPLASHRKSLSVAKTAIASNVHESFDVHGYVSAHVSLDPMLAINDVPNTDHLSLLQLIHTSAEIDMSLCQDFLSCTSSNAIDVGQGDFDSLIFW